MGGVVAAGLGQRRVAADDLLRLAEGGAGEGLGFVHRAVGVLDAAAGELVAGVPGQHGDLAFSVGGAQHVAVFVVAGSPGAAEGGGLLDRPAEVVVDGGFFRAAVDGLQVEDRRAGAHGRIPRAWLGMGMFVVMAA